ncbi:MAG: quaternary ammonium compound efflux SMR transporter SugE [Gammaproteobacteria bacterium]|nr:quaternary ammonium compound efflux SMR transporter SugE [Gammaproteobacteria bacterium]
MAAWISLIIAGLFECVWAVGLKYTHGFSRLGPSLITIVAMVVSFACLAYSLKTLPISVAYVIWTGIGAVSVAIYGIVIFDESANIIKLLCIALIIIGIIGLKATASTN